jgi:hypothetical protein
VFGGAVAEMDTVDVKSRHHQHRALTNAGARKQGEWSINACFDNIIQWISVDHKDHPSQLPDCHTQRLNSPSE